MLIREFIKTRTPSAIKSAFQYFEWAEKFVGICLCESVLGTREIYKKEHDYFTIEVVIFLLPLL